MADSERYRVPFGAWLRSQRGSSGAVGSFARFCDAAGLKPADRVPKLLLQLVDLDAAHDVQDAALEAHGTWQRDGWATTS